MLGKYIKRNLGIVFSFIVIFVTIFIGCTFIISLTEEDTYSNRMRNCNIGEMCLIEGNLHEKEYYEKLFNSEIISAVESPYKTVVNGYYYNPLFIMESDDYNENVIMDYNSFQMYKFPQKFQLNGIDFYVDQNDFSNIPGCFINKSAFSNIEVEPSYYGVIITNENKKALCSYNLDYNKSSDHIIFTGENFSYLEEPVELETAAKIFVIVVAAINVLGIVIYYNYARKNAQDYKVLKHMGYSLIQRILLFLSIPAFIILLCFILSFPAFLLLVNLYNSLTPIYMNCLSFGNFVIRGLLVDVIGSLLFTIICSIVLVVSMDKTTFIEK